MFNIFKMSINDGTYDNLKTGYELDYVKDGAFTVIYSAITGIGFAIKTVGNIAIVSDEILFTPISELFEQDDDAEDSIFTTIFGLTSSFAGGFGFTLNIAGKAFVGLGDMITNLGTVEPVEEKESWFTPPEIVTSTIGGFKYAASGLISAIDPTIKVIDFVEYKVLQPMVNTIINSGNEVAKYAASGIYSGIVNTLTKPNDNIVENNNYTTEEFTLSDDMLAPTYTNEESMIIGLSSNLMIESY